MNKLIPIILLTLGLCLYFTLDTVAIQLIYKDSKGHYHFRCTDKTGGKTIIKYRKEGVYVDGPTGQIFYPMDSSSATRSPDSIKITEMYARMGCRENLGTTP